MPPKMGKRFREIGGYFFAFGCPCNLSFMMVC